MPPVGLKCRIHFGSVKYDALAYLFGNQRPLTSLSADIHLPLAAFNAVHCGTVSFGLADLLRSFKRIHELLVPHEPATKTTRLLMLCFGGAYSRIFPDRSAMQRHIGPGGVWGSWAFGEHPYFIIAVRWTDKHCLIPPLVELQEIPK